MRAVASIAFCLACLSASGADADNPYVGIVDRNVFQLRPPVLVPPVTNPQPPAVVSKLTLTGITTIFGKPLALLTTQPTGKPQDAGKREHYSLRVGQRMDGIEVLSIDAKKGVVRVKNNGAEETLDFINNGAKPLVSAAVPGASPAHANLPNVPSPAGQQVARLGGNRRNASYAPARGVGNAGINPAGIAGGIAPNTRGIQQYQNTMSREEQVLIIEAQRAKMLQEGDETFKILPPTEMTQEVLGGQPGGQPPSPF